MDKQYMKEYTKTHFEQNKGTDSDYLIILERLNKCGWCLVPSRYGFCETIEEAIGWQFENKDWITIRVYDLYAESVEKALVSVHYR